MAYKFTKKPSKTNISVEMSKPQAFKLWLLVCAMDDQFAYQLKSRLFDAFGGVKSSYYKKLIKR